MSAADKLAARLADAQARIVALSDEVLGLQFRIVDLRAALAGLAALCAETPPSPFTPAAVYAAQDALAAVQHIPDTRRPV